METILQQGIPYPLPGARLPGIAPLEIADWLVTDEAFAAQMRLRARLLATRREEVLRLAESARPAAGELLETVLGLLRGRAGYRVGTGEVVRPDGARVPVDPADPLATLGNLVQEDFCLLQKDPASGQHVLCGAVLCFPAGWSLAEKFGRPLTRIHAPVAEYDGQMARRVQRLFDAIRPEQPLWRANALDYHDPSLFAPRREADPRQRPEGIAPYLRSERQCLLRLPESRAVVFSIHTWVVARSVGGCG